jgi:hypothetical protein
MGYNLVYINMREQNTSNAKNQLYVDGYYDTDKYFFLMPYSFSEDYCHYLVFTNVIKMLLYSLL